MANPSATRMMARPNETSRPGLALSPSSDIAFARAVADAVRATPGIADLSPGLMVLAATYGPNERVVGVAVRHISPHDVAVEVHVIVATEISPSDARREDSPEVAPPGEPSDGATLVRIADRVRAAVYRVASSMNLVPIPTVDVFIDDIRVPGEAEHVPAR